MTTFTEADRARMNEIQANLAESQVDESVRREMRRLARRWHETQNQAPTGDRHPSREVLEVSAGTMQATEGFPLFRSEDRYFALLAEPDSHEERDGPWAELANQLSTSDPKALRVAHWLHNRVKPEATILFGSRAKGTPRPDSDIDLMLVGLDEKATGNEAIELCRCIGAAIYGEAPETHLLTMTTEEFRTAEKYRNSMETEALLKGVIIGAKPGLWQSRYA